MACFSYHPSRLTSQHDVLGHRAKRDAMAVLECARMARAAEARKPAPTLVTLAISGVLLLWSAYALSGAGVIATLPFTKLALALICTIYLARAVAFPLLKSSFPDNSTTFWWVSSGICGFIGLVHAYGTLSLWHEL